MNKIAFIFCLLLFTVQAYSQDPRELLYNIEILAPNHAFKPKVDGFAKERIEDELNRGVIAVEGEDNNVYVSWRLLKSDPADVAFDVYRGTGNRSVKLNRRPVTATTDFVDRKASNKTDEYWVIPVTKKGNEAPSEKASVIAKKSLEEPAYISIPLQDEVVPGRRRLGVADLNGDGKFDFILIQPNVSKDPGSRPDSSQVTYKIEAYLNDGTFLWRNDLGDGIEPGVWYSPFIAYDFDGDGKAEIAVKTAPDGIRDADGAVYEGEEWISIWDGMTGEEITRASWPERTERLGNYNRQNRNQLGVAYLDGKTPCLIVGRGTYKAMFVDAYQFTDGQLTKLWSWDGDEENPIVRSQGAHIMLVNDVDEDGRDEMILGSAVLDDDGTLLWSAGLGHPDKVYVTDIDPSHPGLEIFFAVEALHDKDGLGICVRDAKTGELIWSVGEPTVHIGSGMVADIDPSLPGLEGFANEDPKGHRAMRVPGNDNKYLFDAKGNLIGSGEDVPPTGDWLWWDAGKIRQYIAGDREGISVMKYKQGEVQSGFQGRVIMTADLFGDWREEIITALPGELRIYSTTLPANDRRITLLQDNTYRQTITVRTMGYQQPPVPSFYLGE
ncbi:MAG: silent information regulator protein Sir2 [Bacteroidetes bacterium GWD2_45_23]|nr:MAG: silent information regulator protein Sir2 [Bacteroidetes bacterium GWC2_46_850]OFX84085.1 MAG: silent information regulator protein Sir2 [Bacteroidetes bacterium GWD2_45_23]HAR37582.1 silent information regulator protein Sir2 [Porphyromonadaceae bacterium]